MPHKVSPSLRVGESFRSLAAGTHNLVALSGGLNCCARRVHCLSATTISLLRDPEGVDSPPGAVPAGTVIDADVSEITVNATVMVFW